MGSEMPSFLIWSLCIKRLVHHEVLSLVLFMQSLYTLHNLLKKLFTCNYYKTGSSICTTRRLKIADSAKLTRFPIRPASVAWGHPGAKRVIIAPMAMIIIMAQATSHAPCASNCACAEGLHFSAFHYIYFFYDNFAKCMDTTNSKYC